MMIDPITGSLAMQGEDVKLGKKREGDELKPIETTGKSQNSQLDNERENISKQPGTKSITKEDDQLLYNSKGTIVKRDASRLSVMKDRRPLDIET